MALKSGMHYERVKIMLSNDDKEIIDELRKIQKSQDCWKDNIDFVADKLNEIYSVEVKAKALWVI